MKILFIVGLILYGVIVLTVNLRSGQISRGHHYEPKSRYPDPERRAPIETPKYVADELKDIRDQQRS